MKGLAQYVFSVLIALSLCAESLAQSQLQRRLESLSPTDPMGYFLLAEDISGNAKDVGEILLARRLFVLSFVLAEKYQSHPEAAEFPIRASACLALANLETSEDRKRWLRALAGRIDRRYAEQRWDAADAPDQADESAFLLAEAVGLMLSGDGSLARDRLDDPRVHALLEQTRDILDRPGNEASSAAILREAQIWPCPECGNARGVPDRSEGGQVRRLCSTCRGNPGPVISREAHIDYLGYQSLLLHGTQKSWAAELAVGLGRPILDPEPSEIAPTMGVDPTKVYYRAGNWLDQSEFMALSPGQE